MTEMNPRLPLPEAFVARLTRELGPAEAGALCAALDTPPTAAVRLHPQRCALAGQGAVGAAAALPALACDRPVPWSEGGCYLSERPSFTLDTDFHAGAYYVQEPSSQFVGHLLRQVPMRGARLLDLCAAPGGKTTLYASLAGPEGVVVANEIDRRRAAVLADNVRKWGTANVVVTVGDAARFGAMPESFDVVAVDAPCSGEGMFRKDEGARAEWSENNVHLCAKRQEEILREAWRALRPGGLLIYSTCTFNRQEDEGALEGLLAREGGSVEAAEEVPVDPAWGIVCGEAGPFQTFRFFPHRACGEGFFAAVARKAGGDGEPAGAAGASAGRRAAKPRRSPVVPVTRAVGSELARWVEPSVPMRFVETAGGCCGWYEPQAEFVQRCADLLPVSYSGVAMGQLFKGVLKPDPALAFFVELRREALPAAELADERALRYLRRQEVEAAALAEGMNLVTARGRALGFAKRIGNRVNNLYPQSLRIIKQ